MSPKRPTPTIKKGVVLGHFSLIIISVLCCEWMTYRGILNGRKREFEAS